MKKNTAIDMALILMDWAISENYKTKHKRHRVTPEEIDERINNLRSAMDELKKLKD